MIIIKVEIRKLSKWAPKKVCLNSFLILVGGCTIISSEFVYSEEVIALAYPAAILPPLLARDLNQKLIPDLDSLVIDYSKGIVYI